MSFAARPIQRGCGRRKGGGIYGELGLAPGGSPVEAFLLDPPLPIEGMSQITPVGVSTMERDGVTHIIDWIGSQHYPNVADFIEEVRIAGLSRRFPSGLDFSKLTEDSRILTVHARAYVTNAQEFRPKGGEYFCPKRIPHHQTGESDTCLGITWEDVEGGTTDTGEEHPGPRLVAGRLEDVFHPRRPDEYAGRLVRREMPGFAYSAFAPPSGIVGEYRPAIFGSFPIGRLVVVKDEIGGTHEAAMQKAKKAKLEVTEVDE